MVNTIINVIIVFAIYSFILSVVFERTLKMMYEVPLQLFRILYIGFIGSNIWTKISMQAAILFFLHGFNIHDVIFVTTQLG